ncbi:MAG: cyclic nucleotide-binding domain-containing protein [Chloroflexi bacterium]|nr:cyclic nucleotide-binding domain-containing protein [Chloroflexota bacterium]
MTTDTILQRLQELEFTRDLEPDQLEKLAKVSALVQFDEERVIFREQDVGEYIYIIDEGKVALEIYAPGRGRTTILTLGPGELLGWSSIFPGSRKTAGARAMTPVKAIAMNAAQLREIMDEDCMLASAILWRVSSVIASRLKATRLQLLDIFAHSS